MGRGLSELQQSIIVMAYENRDPSINLGGRHVYRESILRECFGWEPRERGWSPFSRKDIGAERYNRGMASLSRALRRLEERGLVEFTHSMLASGWSGVLLTEEGEAEAQRILERREATPTLKKLGDALGIRPSELLKD